MTCLIQGKILLLLDKIPVVSVSFEPRTIVFDILDTSFFDKIDLEDDSNFFDKISDIKEFAKEVASHNYTVVIKRKGKDALTIGKEAKPKISKIISKDIQIDSIKEAAKITKDILD